MFKKKQFSLECLEKLKGGNFHVATVLWCSRTQETGADWNSGLRPEKIFFRQYKKSPH